MSDPRVKDPIRVQTGRLGALRLHASGKTNTSPARVAFMARFDRQVDPANELDPVERHKRATYALREHMARLSMARHPRKAA